MLKFLDMDTPFEYWFQKENSTLSKAQLEKIRIQMEIVLVSTFKMFLNEETSLENVMREVKDYYLCTNLIKETDVITVNIKIDLEKQKLDTISHLLEEVKEEELTGNQVIIRICYSN